MIRDIESASLRDAVLDVGFAETQFWMLALPQTAKNGVFLVRGYLEQVPPGLFGTLRMVNKHSVLRACVSDALRCINLG